MYIIKYVSKIIARKKNAKRINKLIPDVKIKTDQEKTTNKVCPISGWTMSKRDIIEIVKVVSMYLIIKLVFSVQRMVAKNTIKKGFRTSIGWNLGKKNRSIHLLEPLTSTPKIGTNTNAIKEIKKSTIEYLINCSWLKEENTKSIKIPRTTYTKCLKKKK